MKIEIEATEKQLMALSQFFKRLQFEDVRKRSISEDETYDALMDILEQLKKLSDEMDKYKKRIVVNSKTHNRYKTEFDELVKTHHVLIFSDDLVPEDRILIMDSEAEEMERNHLKKTCNKYR